MNGCDRERGVPEAPHAVLREVEALARRGAWPSAASTTGRIRRTPVRPSYASAREVGTSSRNMLRDASRDAETRCQGMLDRSFWEKPNIVVRVKGINGPWEWSRKRGGGMRRPLYMAALLSVVVVLASSPAALAQSEGLNCGDFANQEAAAEIVDTSGDLYGFELDGDGVGLRGLGGRDGRRWDPRAVPAVRAVPVLRRGGPSLWMPAVATAMLLGTCVVGLFASGRRGRGRGGSR